MELATLSCRRPLVFAPRHESIPASNTALPQTYRVCTASRARSQHDIVMQQSVCQFVFAPRHEPDHSLIL